MTSTRKASFKWERKEILKKVFSDFCESTSLHGYRYVMNVNSYFVKFAWFSVISSMTTVGLFFLFLNTSNYIKSGLMTTIDSTTNSIDVWINTY